eukprot:Lithocolla_globosa_v1_NODE_4045_length_1521_cov_22.677353.p1 type:complete len:228 gc:universal NODE_4045_length_1521_cov_22.677353:598-1281(+)
MTLSNQIFVSNQKSQSKKLVMQEMSVVEESQKKVISTKEGDLIVRVYGEKNTGPLVIAFHGVNSNLVDEWDHVASACAKHNFRVVVPNWHSNPKLAPGMFMGVETELVCKVTLDSIVSNFAEPDESIHVMGKSWGGKIAANFCVKNSQIVNKLVLVCPAIKDEDVIRQLEMPTCLIWAKDDWITWYSNCQTFKDLVGDLFFVAFENGGHRIQDSYADVIVNFLEKKD